MIGAAQHRVQQCILQSPATIKIIPSMSYGFVLDEPYDQRHHQNSKGFEDPLTGVMMVKDRIRWVVKKGEVQRIYMQKPGLWGATVEAETHLRLSKKPGKRFLPGGPYRYTVVCSKTLDPTGLPNVLSPGVEKLLTVELDPNRYEDVRPCFTKKRSGGFITGTNYREATVELSLSLQSGEIVIPTANFPGAEMRRTEQSRDRWQSARSMVKWLKRVQ